MALTSFTTWFSSPISEAESDSAGSSSAEEHATSNGPGYSDENQPATSSLRFTFTPTQVARKPRAWQRKPATPFAPRSESQKIWKRVPLQNVTSNINAAWERGGKSGDGIMRPIKKIRVALSDSHNKGNIGSAIAKWDREPSPTKTPRRRRPALHADLEAGKSEGMEDVEPFQVASSSPSEWKITTPAVGELNAAEGASMLPEDINTPEPSRDTDTLPIAHIHSEDDYQAKPSPSKQSIRDQSLTPEHEMNGYADAPEDNREAQSMCGDGLQPTAQDVEPEEALAPVPNPEDYGVPTSGNEQVTLKSTASPSASARVVDNAVEQALSTEEAVTNNEPEQSRYFMQNDHDDTSFLQAFLSRTRAQREAKVSPSQAFSPINTKVGLVPAELQLSSTSGVQDEREYDIPEAEYLSPPSDTTNDHDSTEAQASSPCRRSSRVTRLPRPQRPVTLPNTISLRRLNGNEFVAMQKETQSLAFATRTNTKKNKGSSKTVRERLVQLHAEKHPAISSDAIQGEGKGVQWAEMIARMQGEDGKEVVYVPEPKDESEQPGPENEVVDEAKQDITPMKPVRRRRKENLGNVNGTPAPKGSIEILLADAKQGPENGGQLQVQDGTLGKQTRTRTRSQT